MTCREELKLYKITTFTKVIFDFVLLNFFIYCLYKVIFSNLNLFFLTYWSTSTVNIENNNLNLFNKEIHIDITGLS